MEKFSSRKVLLLSNKHLFAVTAFTPYIISYFLLSMQTSTLNITQHYSIIISSISIKPCIPAPLFSITRLKLRCWEQEWHHSLQKTCWKKKYNPPELEQWKDLKAICCVPRPPQFLIGFSRATLSKALWWEGGRASTYLCPSEPHQSLLCSRSELAGRLLAAKKTSQI